MVITYINFDCVSHILIMLTALVPKEWPLITIL